ncbi:tyrosine-type recombinase/integrase [Nocardia sp. NPDC051570]|uniref:tyrosine-type recombinase/integrase n=1 Tax=Nocardia sp. NPDC051570 TaxID=3364324 RepID=UPI0037B884EF
MTAQGEGRILKETRKRKNGTEYVLWAWYMEIGVKPNGKPDRLAIRRKNRNDLIAARREALAKLAMGEPLRRDKTTVEAWLTHWLYEIAKPRMRPRPWRNYKSAIYRNLVPYIGNVKLVDLEPQHIRLMLKEILKTGKSVRTAEVAYNVLHVSVEDARKEPAFSLRHNVVESVTKPKPNTASQDTTGTQRALPAGSEGRQQKSRKALASDQARTVISTSIERRDPLAVRWAMALLTGVRQGECLGLTLDRVNLEKGTFDLSWALQVIPLKETQEKGDPYPKDAAYPVSAFDITAEFEIIPLHRALCLVRPKTAKSRRVVVIPEPLLILLRAHCAQMEPNPWGLLWTTKTGKPIRPEYDEAAWLAALAAADVPEVVLHAARHTTATLLLEANVPEDVRMAIMGHSSAAAQRVYAHVDLGVKRASMARLDDLIDAEVIDVWHEDQLALEPVRVERADADFKGEVIDVEFGIGFADPRPIEPASTPSQPSLDSAGDWRAAVFQSA